MKHISSLLVAVICILPLVACDEAPGVSQGTQPTSVAQAPYAVTSVPSPVETAEAQRDVPGPIGTAWLEYPTPGITPTQPVPTITPTHVTLEPARLVSPSIVSTGTIDLDIHLSVHNVITGTESVVSLAWSPYGDGFVYMTISGKLYWSDVMGANRALLYSYTNENYDFDTFEQPKIVGSTMYIVHMGANTPERRLPGHLDIVRFAPGQVPSFEHAETLPELWGINWWRPDRASGVLLLSYGLDGYLGGDRLVTLDGDGHIVDSRNIPYMYSGAVQPGGEWLAYATIQQVPEDPHPNTESITAYLLNLRTGERLQISPSGRGSVTNWSPDGRWLIMGDSLLSADGNERIYMAGWLGYDVAWSPGSKLIVSSEHFGGCEPEGCQPYGSNFYVVDLPSRKVARLDADARAAMGFTDIRRPKWSPDGRLLAALAFSPSCPECLPGQVDPGGPFQPQAPGALREAEPVIYLLSVDRGK